MFFNQNDSYMRKYLSALFILCASFFTYAQDTSYVFTPVKNLETTSVKDQARSGTCWSFSSLSFLESEMLRTGKATVDLSEMFVVHKCYEEKAQKYVRMHGSLNFGAGGAFHDALWVLKNYGMMPNDVYSGLNYGEEKHTHGELDEILKGYVDAVLLNKNKKLSTAWYPGYCAVLNSYLGVIPESFIYNGKRFTALSFAKEIVGLNPDDYVSLTSFTHHPFYTSFMIEVPDNWLWKTSYNLPLDELMEVFKNALNNGYTVAWGGDVSEKGFSHKNGLAIVPLEDENTLEGTERSKWEKLPNKDKSGEFYKFDHPRKEKEITQDLRQTAFDNYETTDDHGMHITGLYKDQNGTVYYKVKNSWNTDNKYDGYLYMSEAFARYKTMNIVVHKNAIPEKLKKKLGL